MRRSRGHEAEAAHPRGTAQRGAVRRAGPPPSRGLEGRTLEETLLATARTTLQAGPGAPAYAARGS